MDDHKLAAMINIGRLALITLIRSLPDDIRDDWLMAMRRHRSRGVIDIFKGADGIWIDPADPRMLAAEHEIVQLIKDVAKDPSDH